VTEDLFFGLATVFFANLDCHAGHFWLCENNRFAIRRKFCAIAAAETRREHRSAHAGAIDQASGCA
jgi:hypothetical protein